jgi:hypothetical protein
VCGQVMGGRSGGSRPTPRGRAWRREITLNMNLNTVIGRLGHEFETPKFGPN